MKYRSGMRYHALATDYDGTIATHGYVSESTIQALARLRESGRKLLLVTGRELPDLLGVFAHPELFDRIVAENGALLYQPETKQSRPLSDPPAGRFLELLRQEGVKPLSAGQVIVATNEPNEGVVLRAIHELGLELQVIFNKGAVMVLPSGVNKATGLSAALKELRLSAHNVIGVGDAENDHAFLKYCECSVAVANGLTALKDCADIVTAHDHGDGVAELIDQIITDDLHAYEPRLARHEFTLGTDSAGHAFRIKPYGSRLLVIGESGGGKSTLVTAFLEMLFDKCYQACVIDPEGDYVEMETAVIVGDSKRTPGVESIVQALDQSQSNVIVSLTAVKPEDRPAYFQRLLPALTALRARTGRPHWIVIDEAHHLAPPHAQSAVTALPANFHTVLLVTVHPHHIAPALLRTVDSVLATGPMAGEALNEFCAATGRDTPEFGPLQDGQALGWHVAEPNAFQFKPLEPRSVRRRHRRKYAAGELPVEQSYYFRGPQNKLHLRAQNLQTFIQLGEGVDDETWLFHLRRGEYSDWLRNELKDAELADVVAQVERDSTLSPEESRARIRESIEQRYTAAA